MVRTTFSIDYIWWPVAKQPTPQVRISLCRVEAIKMKDKFALEKTGFKNTYKTSVVKTANTVNYFQK